ncbi:MAG: response regulator [Marinilabiliaceae bacterium]|nr:response regulator [Marinilabiliaceae bacterium]
MKILICEDDRLMQKALNILLGKEGFQIEQALDGTEAFEKVKSEEYDLLIVDIHLPYSSGIELIEYYRHDLLKETPIIVVTAINNKQIREQAETLGITKYIVKPYDPKELVRTIKSTLHIKN